MSLSNKEDTGSVSLLQAVISLHFAVSFFITILTIVGISYDYPVSSFFLMALLQAFIAIPGVVYVALQTNVWLVIYISIQLMTVMCEAYWLLVMIIDDEPVGRWIGLVILTLINVSAVIIAFWFRQNTVKLGAAGGMMKTEKPEEKKPPAFMSSDIEKARSVTSVSGVSMPRTPKKSSPKKKKKSNKSSASSKKSSRVLRKPRKSTPVDSRETANSSEKSVSRVKKSFESSVGTD